MPTYKLTYFPVQALGEPIRLLLTYAGIEFIDNRFDEDDWETKIKPTTPFGQVPVLEVDGKKIDQSVAICRYIAKKCGLYGKDDWEALEIDAAADTLYDLRNRLIEFYHEEHPEARLQKQALTKEIVPFYVERLEKKIQENGGYLVNGKLTYADLVYLGLIENMCFAYGENFIANAENLKALKQKVLAIPSIKAYVARRPKTEF